MCKWMDFFFRHCAVVVLFFPHNQPEVGQKNCGPMFSIVTLDNVKRSPSACRGLKRLICFGRPHGGAGVDVCSESECIDCPVNSLFKIKSFISAACLHWDWQFQTSSSCLSLLHLPLHSFFFLSFQLFSSFEPSSKDSCGAPERPKSLFITVTTRSKARAFSGHAPGACCISVPGFLSGAIQRG